MRRKKINWKKFPGKIMEKIVRRRKINWKNWLFEKFAENEWFFRKKIKEKKNWKIFFVCTQPILLQTEVTT